MDDDDDADDDTEDAMACRDLAKEQTGIKIPLRSTSKFCLPTNPWPKNQVPVTKKTAFAFTKRKFSWRRPEQSNSWDQYGDSSYAASASASAAEGGRGTYSMSEKQSGMRAANRCSLLNRTEDGRPIEMQAHGLTGVAKLETCSQSIKLVLTLGMRQPAAPTPGTRIGTLNLQDGID